MATETRNKAEYLLSLVKRNDHQELKKEILQEDGTLKEGVDELTYTNDDREKEPLLVCDIHLTCLFHLNCCLFPPHLLTGNTKYDRDV